MIKTEEPADVGIVVARFQTHELHEGQTELMDLVVSTHDKYIVFLGLSPIVGSRRNPLDFQARKQMVLEAYPDANVLYIKNVEDDRVWSKSLDDKIADLIGPESTVMLYGGRTSFINSYHGKWPTTEIRQVGYLSATAIRKKIARSTKPNSDWRAGAIHNALNQYPKLVPMVDVAIWNEEGTDLLMARKPKESKWRFIGGYAQPGAEYGVPGCLEGQARKEVSEEAGIAVTDPQYLGSMAIDDWRYRGEADDVSTTFFECKHFSGAPRADDDIEEVKWVDCNKIDDIIIDAHEPLLRFLKLSTKIGNFIVKNPD